MYSGRPSAASALRQGWGMSILERGLVFNGRYRVVGTLGDGGMARVYQAIDTRLGRAVAVKVLHPYYNNQAAFVTRFEQEARLAASLNHPHIMGVYDVGCDDDGSHYIVMEYVEGDTLKRLIARDAPLALPTAAAILRQIGLALDDAHAHGVIHRDVKPENIFLTPARTVHGQGRGLRHRARPRREYAHAHGDGAGLCVVPRAGAGPRATRHRSIGHLRDGHRALRDADGALAVRRGERARRRYDAPQRGPASTFPPHPRPAPHGRCRRAHSPG